MLKVKQILLLLFIGSFVPLVLNAQPIKPQWKLYAKSMTGDQFFYYDLASVKKMPNGHYLVWTKCQDNPDSLNANRKALIETRDRYKPLRGSETPMKNTLDRGADGYYKKWLYTVCKTEIDCKNGKYLQPTTFDFDEDDHIIGSVEDPNPGNHWLGIEPGSHYQTLKDLICK